MRMIEFLSLLAHILVSPFKTRARLEAEIIVLRHQLNVLRRQASSKPRLTVADRLLFVSPLSSPRQSSDGIGRASDCSGAGSRALVAVVQRFQLKSGA